MNRSFGTLVAVVALFAPAAAPYAAEYYLVESLATRAEEPATRAQARELRAIYEDLARVSGVEAQLVYSNDPDLNAFATEIDGEKIVLVQEGLLAQLGGDRDQVAATIGHELAHHEADHIHAGRRKQEGVRVFGAILGAVVGAKVGHDSGRLAGAASAAAVGVGASLVALKFNRSQELEADRLAIGWMIDAGYNPRGMLRLQQQLGALQGKRRAAIFSTHPTSRKRYDAADRVIAKRAPAPELLERDATPLVDEAALADATETIATEREAKLAEALGATKDPLPAAALAPIDGIDFDRYAALSNELVFAGPSEERRVLARAKLDEARLSRLHAGYRSRLREHPALAQRYNVAFFRATQGRLAPWGRDLADSYEHGRPLALAPPYEIDVAASIFAAMRARGAPALEGEARAKAVAEVLAPHGLSYYDFLIGHNWWTRKATIAALAGDTSIVQAYFEPRDTARADAAAAGVHIGGNVKVGNDVRIGGKPGATARRAASDD